MFLKTLELGEHLNVSYLFVCLFIQKLPSSVISWISGSVSGTTGDWDGDRDIHWTDIPFILPRIMIDLAADVVKLRI